MKLTRVGSVRAVAILFMCFLAAGCVGGGKAASRRTIPASSYNMKSPSAYNKWDIKFVKGAYVGHLEASKVIEEVPEHTKNPEVRLLAAEIRSMHDTELRILASWLKEWHTPAPTASFPKEAGGLGGLSGTAYDRELLKFLIGNQQEVLRLATDEQQAGAFSPARQMSERTVQSSTGAIANMRAISNSLNAH